MSLLIPLFRRYIALNSRMIQPRLSAALIMAILGAVFLCPASTSAQTVTWTGAGTTANFSDFANWNSSFTPGTNLNLVFQDGAASGLTLNVNLDNGTPGLFELQSLTFQNNGATTPTNFILTGNALYFSNSTSNITVTTNAGIGAQRTMTVNNQLRLGDLSTLSLVSNGSHTNALRINGNIGLASGATTATLMLNGTSTNAQNLITGSLTGNQNIKILKAGTGRWELSGANTFAGGVSMTAGTLVFSGANVVSGGVSVSGGTLQFNVANTINGGLSITAGVLQFNGANTFNGPITVSGGSLILLGANQINGGVSVFGGTLSARNVGALGGVTSVTLGNLTVSGTLSFSNAVASTQSFDILVNGTGVAAGNGGTISSDSGVLTATVLFNGPILHAGAGGAQVLNLGGVNQNVNRFASTLTNGASGTFGLNKVGTTTWEITGNNTFSGGVTITQGAIRIGPLSGGSLATNLNVQAGANNLRFNTAAGNFGVLETSGTFTSNLGSGPGQVLFALSGGWSAGGGPLDVSLNGGTNAAITWGGTGTNIIPTASELHFNSVTADNVLTFHNPITGAAVNRVVRVTDNPNSTNDMAVMDGVLTVNGFTKAGTGYLALTANNAITGGVTINGGFLRSLDTTANLKLSTVPLRFTAATSNGGILETQGTINAALGTAAGNIAWLANGSGGFSAINNDLSVTLAGGGTLNWASTANFVGAAELQFGSIFSDKVVTFNNPINLGAAARTIRNFDNPLVSTDYAVLPGVISGVGGSLTKAGTGTLVLAADNTYNGLTTVAAGTLRLGNGGSTGSVVGSIVNAGVVSFNYGAGTNKTYAGVISLNGSVEMNSAANAVLQLSAVQTYTGRTTITSGTLRLGAVGGLAAATQVTLGSAGTLDLNGRSQTFAGLNGSGNIISNNGAATVLTLSTTVAGNFTGNILQSSGIISLIKNGPQTLTLGGVNTYSGPTTIALGTLFIQSPAALGLSSVLTFTNGTLATTGNITLTQAVNVNGTAGFQGDGTITVNSSLVSNFAGNRAILSNGTGALVLNGPTITVAEPGFTGTTRILTLGGTRPLTVNGSIQTGGAPAPMVSVNITGSSVTFANDNSYFGRTTVAAGSKLFVGAGQGAGNLSGTAIVTAGTPQGQIIFNRGNLYTYTGFISGGGGVVIDDGAVGGGVQFNTAQQYTGGTSVQKGTLFYGTANALQTGGGLAVALTGTVDFNGFAATVGSINDLNGTGGFITNNSVATGMVFSVGGAANSTFSGRILNGATNAGIALQKNGTGTLTLFGDNTFAGLPTVVKTVLGVNTFMNASTLAAGTLAVGSDTALGPGAWITNGTIIGTSLVPNEPRTISNPIFTLTNTTIGGATDITFDRIVNLQGNRALTINNTASTTINVLEFAESVTGRTLTMNVNGPTLVHTLTHGLSTTNGNLVVNFTNSQILTLDGPNNYDGSTMLSGTGTLLVGAPNGLGDTAITVSGGAVLRIASFASVQNANRSMTINSGGTVIIESGGAMGNANGTVNVNAGGLLVVDGQTAAGTISVNGSGVLTGLGDINGPIQLSSGGTFKISGNSIGQPSLAGLILNGGVLEYQLGTPGVTTQNDSIQMRSTPPQITDAIFRLLPQPGFGVGVYPMITNYSGNVGGALRVNTAVTGYDFTFDNNDGFINLIVGLSAGVSLTWKGNDSSVWSATAATNNWVNSASTAVTYNEGNHDFVTFNDTAVTSNITLDADFSPGNVVFSNMNTTFTLNGGRITGPTGLNVVGTGTVVLANDNNYTGITQINAGGVLQVGTGSTGSILSTATIGNDGTLIFNRDNATAFNGTIYGTGKVYKEGAGTLTFGGTNVYTGGLTINGGTVRFSGASTLPSVGNVTVNGTTLILDNAQNQVTETLNILGGGTTNITTSSLTSNVITISNGTLNISALNVSATATGVSGNVVNLLGGTINVNVAPLTANSLVLGGGAVTSNAIIFLNGGQSLMLGGNVTYNAANNPVTDAAGALISGGPVNFNNTVRTFNIAESANTFDELTIDSSLIVGTGGITKTGAGTLYLRGSSNATGVHTLAAGTLKLRQNSSIGTGGLFVFGGNIQSDGTAVTLNNTVTLTSNLTITGASDLTFAGPVIGAGANRTLNVTNSATTTFNLINIAETTETGARAMIITGSGNVIINSISDVDSTQGSFVVQGAGLSLTLANNNSYNGLTSIRDGTVYFSLPDVFGSTTTSDILVGNPTGPVNPKILTTGGVTMARDFDVFASTGGGSVTFGSQTADTSVFSGAITFSSSITLTSASGGDVFFSGPLTGGAATAGIIKSGSGVVYISGGANTWTGATQITTGTLRLAAGSNRLSTLADLSIDSQNSSVFDLNGFNQAVNQLLNGTNGGGLITNGASASTSLLTAAGGTFGGVISNGAGTVGLIKSSAGTLTLNGANTYSGLTTVAGGFLAVNGSLGATSVHVDAGAELLGSGTIGGPVNNAGTVVGNLTLAGALTSSGAINAGDVGTTGVLTLNSLVLNGGTITFDLNDPADPTGSDQLVVSNLPTLNALTNLVFNQLTEFGAGTYRLMSGYGTNLFSSLSNFNYAANSGLYHFVLVNNQGALDLDVTQNFNSVTWVGGTPGATNLWDTTTANWSGDATVFSNDLSIANFGTGTSIVAVSVEAAGVSPQSMVVTDDGSHNYTFSGGAITSNGSLTKSGVGTLTFLNSASFAAGATIGNGGTGGTLIIGGPTFQGDINVINPAIVVFNRAGTFTYNNSISGDGSVRIDDGTVTFGGPNTYTGLTTIAAAKTLIIGGTGGSLTGSVTNLGTLRFDRTQSYAGVISGAGTVSIDSGTVDFSKLQLYGGVTNIANGATLVLGGSAGAVTGAITNAGTLSLARTMTFANALSGVGGVSIDGSGTTVTFNTSQTYGGNTNISSGATLALASGGSVAGTIANSGILSIGYATTFTNSVTGSGAVSIDASGTVNFTANQAYLGMTTIAGGTTLVLANPSGALTGGVFNSGVLSFNRSQIYGGVIQGNGVVNINNGPVTFNAAQTYLGATNIAASTQLILGGSGGSLAGNVVNTGTLSFNRTQNYDAVISGNGAVTITSGDVTFSKAQTYLGGTTINSGAKLVLGSSAGSVAGAIVNAGTVSFGYGMTFTNVISGAGGVTIDAGTVIFTGANSYNGATVIAATGTLQVGDGGATGAIVGDVTNGNVLAFNRTGSLPYGGVISSTGAVSIAGGTVIYTGANTYSGMTTIAPTGRLQIGNGGATGSIAGDVTNGNVLAFNRTGSLSYTGTISGAGSVSIDAGNVVFSKDQTYSGSTTIAALTSLQLGSGGAGGLLSGNVVNSGVLTFSGGSVVYSGDITGNGHVAVNSGPVTFLGTNGYTGATSIAATATLNVGNGGATGTITGNISNSGVLNFNRNDNTLVYGGNITGIGGVSINGGGTIKFTGDNNYFNGTTIVSGTLQIGNGGNVGSVGGSIANSGVLAFNRTDTITFTNVVGGTGGVAVNSGTVQFSGASNYTGATTIASGATLKLNNGGSLASTKYSVEGTLTFNNSLDAVYNGTIIGSASGAINKDGLNTFTLAGNGSGYSGTTAVTSGTLLVIGSLGNGAVSVANGAVLGGNGTIGGVVTSTGAILPAGNSVGTLTLGGLILNGGSLNFTLDTLAGSDRLFLNTNTAPTVNFNTNINLTALSGFGLGDYHLIDWLSTGTNQMSTDDFGRLQLGINTLNGLNVDLVNSAGALILSVTTVTSNSIAWVGNNGTWDSGVTANWTGDALTFTNGVSSVTFNDAGLTKSVTVDGAGVQPQHMLVDNSSGAGNTYTFSGGIVNALGGLTKQGTGTVVFTNTNTFASGVTLANGVIQIGNGGSSGALNGNIANSGIVAFNRTGTLTYANVISGSGAVSVNGGLTLILTGANTYTGMTTVVAGTLQIGDGNNTGSIVADVTNGGVVVFNRSDSLTYDGTISGVGSVEIRSGIVTFADAQTYGGGTLITDGASLIIGGGNGSLTGNVTNSGSLTFARTQTYGGTISGKGSVTISAGDVTFNAVQTYTGGTAVSNGAKLILAGSSSLVSDVANAGTLSFASSQTYGKSITGLGNVTIDAADVNFTAAQNYSGGTAIAGGAKLTLGGSAGSLVGDVANAGTLSFARTQTYGGSITGVGNVVIASGDVTFNNAQNYSGGTAVAASAKLILGGSAGSITGAIANAGTVSFNRTQAYGGSITGAGNVTIDSGNVTFTVPQNYGGGTSITFGTSLILAGPNGSITGNVTDSGTLTFARSDTHTFGGVINGIGGVTVTNGMTLVLTGANTYTGPTAVVTSTLQIGAGGTAGSIQSDVANNGLVVFNHTDTTPYAGVISGSGAVSLTNGVTLVLTGANTYTGQTIVDGSALQLGNGGASGSIVGNITNGGTVTFNRDSTPLAYGGVISGTGVVNVAAGNITFTADQTYTGITTIANGAVLHVGTASAAAGNLTGSVFVNTGGVLSFDNANGTRLYDNSITGGGAVRIDNLTHWEFSAVQTYGGMTTIGNGADLTLRSGSNLGADVSLGTGASLTYFQGTKTYSGIISGAGGVALSGNADITLLGTNTYAGPTTIGSGSILKIGAGGISGMIGGSVANSGTFVINRSGTYAFNGAISGAGGFTQAGSSTTTLNGTNLYTGPTSVAAGMLTIAGSLANTPITVAATLSGNGSVGGTVTVLSGGVLSGSLTIGGQVASNGTITPGSSAVPAGILAMNSLILNGGAINFELFAPGSNDRITLTTGAAAPTVNGNVNLVYSNLAAGTYNLITGYTGSIINFGLLSSPTTIGAYGLTLNNNNGSLTLDVVQNGANLTWNSGSGNWNHDTGTFSGATFADGDNVTFADSGAASVITVTTPNGVQPGSMIINNDVASPYTFQGGPIKGVTGVIKQGVGAATFNNANTYTGGTTISGGTFTLASGGSIVNTGNVLITSGTLNVAAGGSINGAGTTYVNGGTLVNNNAISGAIVVNNTGLYKGTGGGSTVNVKAGGTWSPGNSVGTQVTGNMDVTYDAQSQLIIEFRDVSGPEGAGWDLIDLGTGILHIDANNVGGGDRIKLFVSSFRFDNTGPGGGSPGPSPNGFNNAAAENGATPQTYFWRFLKVDDDSKIVVDDPQPGSVGGRFLVIDNAADGVFNDSVAGAANPFSRPVSSMGQGTFRVLTGQELGMSPGLYLVYSAIPEPSSVILCGMASLAAGWYGRRRLKKSKDAATPADPTTPEAATEQIS